MFEHFTEHARQVFVLADDEARRLKHAYIGTEHFLLGLVRDEEAVAGRALASFHVKIDRLRSDVVRVVGLGDEEVPRRALPLTPRVATIIELSEAEAREAGREIVGTEHLLLGLAREGNGVANLILFNYGVSSEAVRARVQDLLSGQKPRRH